MANTWIAHGIIVDKRLEMPYRDAKLSVDSNGNEIDPKEHATVHLFENLFNCVLFTGDEYFVNSQVPPASKKGSEKACDIAIKFVDGNLQHRIFCFAEAKRARNKTHAKIQDVERQALGYCADHLAANSDIGRVVPSFGDDNVSGGATTPTDFDYASASAAYLTPDPISTGVGFFPDRGDVQSTKLDANTFTDTARTIRRATSKEQSHLTQDNYVAVSVLKPGRTIADTMFRLKPKRGIIMDKKGRELEQVICSTDNGDQCCWIYIGKATRRCYWTWTLDVDGKGKQVNSLGV